MKINEQKKIQSFIKENRERGCASYTLFGVTVDYDFKYDYNFNVRNSISMWCEMKHVLSILQKDANIIQMKIQSNTGSQQIMNIEDVDCNLVRWVLINNEEKAKSFFSLQDAKKSILKTSKSYQYDLYKTKSKLVKFKDGAPTDMKVAIDYDGENIFFLKREKSCAK